MLEIAVIIAVVSALLYSLPLILNNRATGADWAVFILAVLLFATLAKNERQQWE